MKAYTYALLTLLLLPNLTFAATASLQNFFIGLTNLFNDVLIPFMFGIAFLFFVINAIRYFVIEGNNEDGRKNAKALAVYGVAAFVFLIIFWGIVNMLSNSTGLAGKTQPRADYVDSGTLPYCPPGSPGPC
jgi:succinate dehydrogenase/fumarate reductase cytochrome b subunit